MMKLTIDSVINKSKYMDISIDGYVPIDIKLFDTIGNVPLYYRLGDGKKSLLEIAVLPENGFLSAITLVIINPECVHKVDTALEKLLVDSSGIPVVNLEIWKSQINNSFSQRFIDDFDFDIQAIVSPTSIMLNIAKNEEEINWIKCSDRFYVGINDKKNITSMLLDKLTQEEISNFFEAIS
ncbi:hypothetical protein [Providencia rettgeri]|uniref:hypothetical protein n=1 Tax=Providencia rettgeri TaxID=587 RepID=UPI002010D673|nr:hypothetical protein [Providencia rettgeri]